MIDYWCNAFTPDREALWAEVIARDGLSIRTRSSDSKDGFCEPAEMVERMDQVGVDTVVLPVCEPVVQLGDDPQDQAAFQEFAHYAVRESELKSLVATYPGRFVGVFSVNPDAGLRIWTKPPKLPTLSGVSASTVTPTVGIGLSTTPTIGRTTNCALSTVFRSPCKPELRGAT